MRIVAGAFKGRALASVGKGDPGAHLRPTTDRTRESLFNMLSGGRFGDPITDARVLDLFAGTGALGLEALSRGATHATFVDDGTKSTSLIKQNIGICEAQAQTKLIRRDARKLPENPGAPYDLIFLDPPYGKGLGETALTQALKQNWIAKDALIVWEESATIAPPEELTYLDARKYGDTTITLLQA
ncbi:Ribosomal RNA small subunit methyltransferase D [Thalassovita gelatinovora]|uniref:Ribosomal RNA small subunit methyltransferase D n=1 Tax=Thalassovita gelatinovora TaxID=53501 RepID=A0A0P1FV10_THAGE|nr:16S rRNA (guanine(966)-N(2))-methyltransferase RsmD [Thalassovita gelatinovora]QIZ80786.1 16S rRNA (guanine(966)-N(2))-methyltransferase RsmD [Thalassovita gelatinovora]CUH63166.1 Ribosomal RNA small subunit methyltransferase D [Thalassovita gelatinovora]SEQ62841.1 16S rRNA (guanine966-N2)-methyltransferase [Thalassovita gelatinovora]